MADFKNVLFFTSGYPHKNNPMNCPFIGHRIACIRKRGFGADVMNLTKLKLFSSGSFLKNILYFWTLFFPFLVRERYEFVGKEYNIYRVYYSFLSKFWLLILIYFITKKNNYSVFHYHFLWSTKELVFLKKYLKIPSIISVHGSDLHETAARDEKSRFDFIEAVDFADKIIYVSKGLRKMGENLGFCRKEKDVVIGNGFSPNLFNLTKKRSADPTFGFVGHLYKVKGVDRLPDIFKNIKNEIPNAKLLIVGGGEPSDSMRNFMENKFKQYDLSSSVKFVGEILPTSMIEYYSKMDILLVPSRNEGFPCAIVEARACGVSVVGAEVGGIAEAIEHDGVLVREGKNFIDNFSREAVNLLNNLEDREIVSTNAKKFDWNNIVDSEIKIYRDIIYSKKDD